MAISNPEKHSHQHRPRCRKVRASLVDHLEGLLSPQEGETVEEHLKVCPRCSAEKKALQHTLSLLSHRELPEPEENFWVELRYQVLRGVREKQAVSRRRPVVPAKAWVPAVAFACLMVFLFLWWSNPMLPPIPGGEPLLVHLEEEGLHSLRQLGESALSFDDIAAVRTPGDSLAELLASISRPEEMLERVLARDQMAENPDLWEDVVEEEFASKLPVEALLDDLNEGQLKELSLRLKQLMG